MEQKPEPTQSRKKRLHPTEEEVLEEIRQRGRAARNVRLLHEERMTFGERTADVLAQRVGSWTFILAFLSLCMIWAGVNSLRLLFTPWDPYPFILLNLFLSLLAGLQAPVIMMSQNRQTERDRLHAEQDYEVNLKAELEIEELHLKMDTLRQQQWHELLALQQRQIEMLEEQVCLLRGLHAQHCGVNDEAAKNPPR